MPFWLSQVLFWVGAGLIPMLVYIIIDVIKGGDSWLDRKPVSDTEQYQPLLFISVLAGPIIGMFMFAALGFTILYWFVVAITRGLSFLTGGKS